MNHPQFLLVRGGKPEEEHTKNTTFLLTRYGSLGLEIGKVFSRG